MAVTVTKKAANLLRGAYDGETTYSKVNWRNNCDLFTNDRGVLYSIANGGQITCLSEYPNDDFNYAGPALDSNKWNEVMTAVVFNNQCIMDLGSGFSWKHTLLCHKDALAIAVEIDMHGYGDFVISIRRGCRTVAFTLVAEQKQIEPQPPPEEPQYEDNLIVITSVSGEGTDRDEKINMSLSGELVISLKDIESKVTYSQGDDTIIAKLGFLPSVWAGYPYYDHIQFSGGTVGGIRIDSIS